MRNSVKPLPRPEPFRVFLRLGLSLLVVGFVAALLAGPSAHATSRIVNHSLLGDECTPQTNPYGSSTTIADCVTSTTGPAATVTLTISYRSGEVSWSACIGSSASGSTVQLYINGSLEDSSQVASNGCTPGKEFALCLQTGSYNAVAVDQPYGQASAVLRVEDSGCASPAVLSATAGVGGSGGTARHSGGLAFTGADIALLVIAAVALMTVGTAIVKMTKHRRAAG